MAQPENTTGPAEILLQALFNPYKLFSSKD